MLVSTYFFVGHVNTIPTSLFEPGRARRRYTKKFKSELVAQCRGLGVSMARVAMAHGINASLLRRWVVQSTGCYDVALKLESRIEAGCLAHCRRKFDELVKIKGSEVAQEAFYASAGCTRSSVRSLV